MDPRIAARNAAGLLGIVPATAAGLAVGGVRGKRAGFDAALPRWVD